MQVAGGDAGGEDGRDCVETVGRELIVDVAPHLPRKKCAFLIDDSGISGHSLVAMPFARSAIQNRTVTVKQ